MRKLTMLKAKIRSIIQQGEGLQVEFKECNSALSKNIFETVCAFLNRSGGELLLGVNDAGHITGVQSAFITKVKNNFVVAMNNPQKLNPPFYLSIEEIELDGKTILYIYVPESSQVHRCNNRIFDRNEDGDFDITDKQHLVLTLYLRKQTSYSENKIYPYVELADLRKDVITQTRKMAEIQREEHPWGGMNDMELLKSAQLYGHDFQTGKKGISLAGILLFGKESTILSVLPHFKTDAILRRDDVDRYDDRDYICVNLIDSFDRLLRFGEKHLNDPFYLEREQRISLRSHILREVVSNLLIHREFTSPFPAKFVIDQKSFYTENSNKPHNPGIIDPSSFSPCPKNPAIARVFREIGRADELGSGVRKLFKYCKAFSGSDPELVEGDVFRFILPLKAKIIEETDEQLELAGTQLAPSRHPVGTQSEPSQNDAQVLELCLEPKAFNELIKVMNWTDRTKFRRRFLTPLVEQRLIEMTVPDKPNSRLQKYVITKKGKEFLETDEQLELAGTQLAPSWHPVGTQSEPSQNDAQVLELCLEPKAFNELIKVMNWTDRTKFRRRFLAPLVEQRLIEMTVPDKPNSRLQKYVITKKGKELLEKK
jgi:ATP-dependent DNA helicase RecG